jgi:hypothetical protein
MWNCLHISSIKDVHIWLWITLYFDFSDPKVQTAAQTGLLIPSSFSNFPNFPSIRDYGVSWSAETSKEQEVEDYRPDKTTQYWFQVTMPQPCIMFFGCLAEQNIHMHGGLIEHPDSVSFLWYQLVASLQPNLAYKDLFGSLSELHTYICNTVFIINGCICNFFHDRSPTMCW